MVSKEAVGQGHFRVIKYNRANYIALTVPYSAGLVSFVNMGHERDNILSHSLFTIHKMAIA